MPRYLRKIGTDELYAYSELLFKRGDMEYYVEAKTPAVEPENEEVLQIVPPLEVLEATVKKPVVSPRKLTAKKPIKKQVKKVSKTL
jgi:hypothetical protein